MQYEAVWTVAAAASRQQAAQRQVPPGANAAGGTRILRASTEAVKARRTSPGDPVRMRVNTTQNKACVFGLDSLPGALS